MESNIQHSKIIKRLTADVMHARQETEELKRGQIELAVIISRTPLFMMVVDRDRRVKKVSDAILQFTGRTLDEVVGLRGGEALRCVHHLDDPRGCGYGPQCDSCSIRRMVQDTLDTGRSHNKVEATLSFIDDCRDKRYLLVSTTLIENPDKQALVFVEDVTERKKAETERARLIRELEKALSEIKRLSGMLPICASCKKIRDDSGYWNQLEAFIEKHSAAEFSHSLCPDYAQRLYPEFNLK